MWVKLCCSNFQGMNFTFFFLYNIEFIRLTLKVYFWIYYKLSSHGLGCKKIFVCKMKRERINFFYAMPKEYFNQNMLDMYFELTICSGVDEWYFRIHSKILHIT